MDWIIKTFTSEISVGGVSLPFTLLDFLLYFILPVFGVLTLYFIVRFAVRRLAEKYAADKEKKDLIILRTKHIFRFIWVLTILLSAAALFGINTLKIFNNIFQILKTPFYSSGKTKISVLTLFMFIPVGLLASWVGKMFSAYLKSRDLGKFGLDDSQTFTVTKLLRYTVMIIVFLIGLSLIGINISTIGVIFGVLGIGIGFGFQFLIADLISGITLISMGLLKEGDFIHVEGFDGTIRNIRLVNTEIVTFENESLIIPNNKITTGIIHNYSYKDRNVVLVNQVDVSYNSDLDKVTELLKTVGSGNPWREKGKENIVRVVNFAESGITMELRTWIKDVRDRLDANSWVNLEIWRIFKENNVEIPFPQRVVTFSSKERQP